MGDPKNRGLRKAVGWRDEGEEGDGAAGAGGVGLVVLVAVGGIPQNGGVRAPQKM